MKRLLAAAAAASVALGVGSVGLAPAAHAAVTNPADHPSPITVKGDDGKTYTDGQDTLPGYDDVECTYIPGAWFDFENNRVHYADGQSIPWTEWDRATGYEAWKAKQTKATPSSAPTAKASGNPASAPTSKASSGGATKTTTKKPSRAASPTVASTPTTSLTSATGQPSAAATATAAPTEAASSAAAAPATTASEAAAPVTTESASPATAEATTDAQLTEVAADTSGGSASGLAIIGGLVAVGALLLGGNAVYRRTRKESVQ